MVRPQIQKSCPKGTQRNVLPADPRTSADFVVAGAGRRLNAFRSPVIPKLRSTNQRTAWHRQIILSDDKAYRKRRGRSSLCCRVDAAFVL